MKKQIILFLNLLVTNASHPMDFEPPKKLKSNTLLSLDFFSLTNRLERVGEGADYVDRQDGVLYQIKNEKLLMFFTKDLSSKGCYCFSFALLSDGIALNQDGSLLVALKDPQNKVNQTNSLHAIAGAAYNINSKKCVYLEDDYFDSSAGIKVNIGFLGDDFIINCLISKTRWDLSKMKH